MRTTFLIATKFACSGQPANFPLTSHGEIVTPVSGYNPLVNCIGKHDFPHPSPEPVV